MRILIVGSTGVLGRQVIPRLLERGHVVRALVRTDAQRAAWSRLGAEPVRGDIFDPASLAIGAAGCDAALHLATAVPKPGQAQDWSLNDRIRREGTANLIAAVARAGVRRYVQQSITLIYGDRGSEVVDEDAPLQPPEFARSAVDMEGLVRQASVDWCILRGGLLYGPTTGREDQWLQAAREGTLEIPGAGQALQSLVHAADMARAIVAATEDAAGGSIYNVVDDYPVSFQACFRYVAALADGPEPPLGGELALPSLGCSNARLRHELGWSPAYPSFRSGLAYLSGR